MDVGDQYICGNVQDGMHYVERILEAPGESQLQMSLKIMTKNKIDSRRDISKEDYKNVSSRKTRQFRHSRGFRA